MKKLITVISIFFSLAASAQVKKDTTATITDSTEFITIRDLQDFDKYLQDKFTVKEYNVIMAGLRQQMQIAADRYFLKPKKK